ncbi:MAG: hypothetical protein WDM81_15240 [Rhizomicrobium sp.]
MTASQALAYPAVQLFVERATQTMDSFEFTDADAPSVATICKRLDGIPLAIELAAATIESLGVRGLAAQLDNLFDVLTRGHRGAFPRHRTLRAAIDWSYGLLTPREATILNRLSVFRWRFTLEAAQAVVADDEIRRANVVAGLAELTSKSLVAADISQSVVQYRLLEVTRAYAAEKLKETDSAADVQKRHALSLRKLLEAARTRMDGRKRDRLDRGIRQMGRRRERRPRLVLRAVGRHPLGRRPHHRLCTALASPFTHARVPRAARARACARDRGRASRSAPGNGPACRPRRRPHVYRQRQRNVFLCPGPGTGAVARRQGLSPSRPLGNRDQRLLLRRRSRGARARRGLLQSRAAGQQLRRTQGRTSADVRGAFHGRGIWRRRAFTPTRP